MAGMGKVNAPRKFHSSPLKIGRIPKGKDRLPTMHFSEASCETSRGVQNLYM